MSKTLTPLGEVLAIAGAVIAAVTVLVVVYLLGMNAGLDSARDIVCDNAQSQYEYPYLCEGR